MDNNGLIRDSLEKFIKICKSGEAPNRYSLYNYITVPYGADRTIDLEIVKFNESGTNVTLVAKQCPPESKDYEKNDGREYGSTERYIGYLFNSSIKAVIENTMYNAIPQILREAIMPIPKTYDHIIIYGDGFRYDRTGSKTSRLTIWPPTVGDVHSIYYNDNERRKRTLQGTGDPVIWMLSDRNASGNQSNYVLGDGSFVGGNEYEGTYKPNYCTFGICL